MVSFPAWSGGDEPSGHPPLPGFVLRGEQSGRMAEKRWYRGFSPPFQKGGFLFLEVGFVRQSVLFWQTQRTDPADAELASHRLLVRAGLIQRFTSGIYGLTPLGLMAQQRIEDLVREELTQAGAQEVRLPFVQPFDLWRRSGRGAEDLPELMRLRDRRGEELALALTAEEAMTELVRRQGVHASQLPLLLTQTGLKFRDELRPRGGLMRLREFLMQDAYSFDLDEQGMTESFARMRLAYRRVFERLDLDVREVAAASGMMGGAGALEFQMPLAAGEDEIIACRACGYVANREAARRSPRGGMGKGVASLSPVETPGATQIATLATALGCREADILKAVFYDKAGTTVLALVLGDRQVGEEKLQAVVGGSLRPLAAEEAHGRGLVVGYAGPVALEVTGTLIIVADMEVEQASGLVCGANREGWHLAGVTPGRDFSWQMAADIAQVAEGDACPECGMPLGVERTLELGHIFRLGTRYSERLGLHCQGSDNVLRPLWMGSYGIGISRLLAAVIERHHDDRGIVWPAEAAPYAVHLLVLGEDSDVTTLAQEVAGAWQDRLLWDDRAVTAGVKFHDADLLGLPWRLTVSRRSLAQGGVELRRRLDGQTRMVRREEVPQMLRDLLTGDAGQG